MTNKYIIFVPGKNPKPPAKQHLSCLWRALTEGVRRAEPSIVADFEKKFNSFELTAWNDTYYHEQKDIVQEMPWIDAVINQHNATEQDVKDANAWHRKLDRFLYNVVDRFPILISLLSKDLKSNASELEAYFGNAQNVACDVREILKQQLRRLLKDDNQVLIVAHSLGSVIAYDTLWELNHLEHNTNQVDLFLSIGSPLGMRYVQHRLMGGKYAKPAHHYPHNIKHWINLSAVGDVTAVDIEISDDFSKMTELGYTEKIEDHCVGIYNFFRNDEGLNPHRSYGYLVNPAVGRIIADWWMKD